MEQALGIVALLFMLGAFLLSVFFSLIIGVLPNWVGLGSFQ